MQGALISIGATFTIQNPQAGATYNVVGTGPTIPTGTIQFSGAATYNPASGLLVFGWVNATCAFEANAVRYFNTFNIIWTVSINGGAPQNAGTSNNPLYVCLAGPTPAGVPTPFRTTVHLACSVAGATTTDQAVANSWSQLTGLSFNGWNTTTLDWTRKLLYYIAGHPFYDSGAFFTVDLLTITNNSGQCGTWANLLNDAILLNCSDSTRVKVISANLIAPNKYFLVKDWMPNAWAGAKNLIFAPPGVWFAAPGPFMFPTPVPPNVYGDFTSLNTLPGQNTAPPQEKVFNNHVITKYLPGGGTTASQSGSGSSSGAPAVYYDPSYGVTYTGPADLQQKSIGGVGPDGAAVAGQYQIAMSQTPAALVVQFV